MEDKSRIMGEVRFQSLVKSLQSADKRNHEEPFAEGARLVGKKDLKSYENILLETVIDKIAEGPEYGEDFSIKFAQNLKRRLEGHSEGIDYAKAGEVINRIIAFPGANRDTRKILLGYLFEVPSLRISDKTVAVVASVIDSDKASNPDSFENEAVETAIDAAKGYIGRNRKEETPIKHLYQLVVAKLLEGKLPEGSVRSFVRELVSEFETEDELLTLKDIRDSEMLPRDIRDTARKEIERA